MHISNNLSVPNPRNKIYILYYTINNIFIYSMLTVHDYDVINYMHIGVFFDLAPDTTYFYTCQLESIIIKL